MQYPLPLPEICLNPKHVIDADKPTHIAWWAKRLNVSEPELRAAVDEVGPGALDVYCYLRGVSAKSSTRYHKPQHQTIPRVGRDELHRRAGRRGPSPRDEMTGRMALASRRAKQGIRNRAARTRQG